MDLFGGGSLCGRATLPLIGKHNARNTVAALAMASEAASAPLDKLIAALPGFRGSKRRQELVGITNDVHVYDDTQHGFWLYVDRDPETNLAPAADAWQRLKAYLRRVLGN